MYPSPSTNYSSDDWTNIVTELAKKLGVTIPTGFDPANPTVSDRCVTEFLQLTKADSPRPLRSLSSRLDLSKVNGSAFISQHVEPLLKQTGRLLDRALATDREYFRLRVEQFNAQLELCQFFLLDNIHQAEIQAQIYKLPLLEANADLTAFSRNSKANDNINGLYNKIFNDGYGFALKVSNCLGDEGYKALRAYASQIAVNNANLSENAGQTGSRFPQGGNWNSQNSADLRLSKAGAIWEGTALQFDYTFPLQNFISGSGVERQLAESDSNVESARKTNFETKQQFYQMDADNFKLWRRNIAVGMMQAKYDAMVDPKGALNYADRLSALEKRQQADVEAAYGRMLAIKDGLKMVYNIDVPYFPQRRQ